MDKQFIIVVCGPTASGKTALSVELAKRLSGEIISADSMQIYRGMNIATAKPTEEEKQGIPHYLMDFLDPHDSFSVADYVKAAHGIIADIAARGKLPIITGGTGLYISSLIDNLSFEETECDYAYRDELRKLAQENGNGFLLGMLREIDPETAEKLHENNLNRIIRALEVYKTTGKTMSEQQRLSRLAPSPYEPCMIQLDYDRETLYDRINRRVDQLVHQGLVDSDAKVADMLRRSGKPVVLAVNKVDSIQKYMMDVYEFYNLGIGEPFAISAANRQGLGDMLDEVVKHFPEDTGEDEDSDIPKIAIVGKPNVGKSSLINKLLGEDRVIVSDVAGTTRDAVDTKVTWNEKDYIFIDTAGLRRKAKVKEEIERFSVIRTVTAVERADVVVVMIDASEGVTEQDAKIAGIAHEKGKGVIIAVNKWDAIEKNDKTIYKHTNRIREVLSFMPYAEIVFISARTGLRISRMFETLDAVIENQTMRIQTGVLNEILAEAVAMQQPPSDRGRRLKIFYMTQVAVKPPTFVIFVNDKELMHFSYTRYLENKIRDAFDFGGTPLKFIVRERGEKE